MRPRWLSLFLLPLLAACNSNSDLSASSETVSQQQIDTIINNIQTQYPKLDHQLKQQILDVAVRAIENMVFVKGGSFMMGDFRAPCDSKDVKRMDWTPEAKCKSPSTTGEEYLHKVTLDSYSLSKYETSMADLDVYFQTLGTPYDKEFVQWSIGHKSLMRDSDEYKEMFNTFSKLPARTKKWQQAKDYCQWLGSLTKLPVDLPTEAQWEYAARSRGKKLYYATNNGYLQYKDGLFYDEKIGRYRDYKPDEWNVSGLDNNQTGRWAPNPLGIFDMTNNAAEWVSDWYSPDYYQHSPEINPKGPKKGIEKIRRGGIGQKTFDRGHFKPEQGKYHSSYGLRCIINSKVQ